MNYEKIYFDLISKAKNENRKRYNKNNSRYIYYENHHIKPKSLGGNNDKEKLILLTAKEHYIAHKLLIQFCEGIDKRNMVFALHKMSYSKTNKYIKSSRDYDYINNLQSIINKGENHPNFGRKYNLESKLLMSKSALGRKRSDEEKNSISNGLKLAYENGTNISYWQGKIRTIESKKKMSDSQKNKIWINNNIIHKKINNNVDIPNGWNRGMLKHKI